MNAFRAKAYAGYALSHDWWTWDHPRIRTAMQAARLVHITTVIDGALESNKNARRQPCSWSELCGNGRIRRDLHNLMKMKRGQHAFTDIVLLGIATSLGIDLRQLHPTADEWIIHATAELCGGRITVADASQYWQYRRRVSASHAQSNGKSVLVDEAAVERVLSLLEPKLKEIDRELELRGNAS